MSFDVDKLNYGAQPSGQVTAVHSYENTNDSLSTIEADDYFDSIAANVDQGDVFIVRGSDGVRFYKIANDSNSDVNLAPMQDDRERIYFSDWDVTTNSLFVTSPISGDIKRFVVIQNVNVDADTDLGIELDDTDVQSGSGPSAVAVTVTNAGSAGDVHKDEDINTDNSVTKDNDIELTTDASASTGSVSGYVELQATGLN